MTFEEVYQQIRKMHYEILDILTEYRDEWCDDCKRFNTVIREALKREPSEDGTLEVKIAERNQWRADVEAIKSVPSADRPKGEWVKKTFGYGECPDCIDRQELIGSIQYLFDGLADSWVEASEKIIEIIREEPTVPQKDYTEQQIRDTFNSGYSCGMQNEWITDEPPVDGQEVIATAYWPEYGDSTIAVGHIDRFDKWHLYSPTEGELIKGFEVIAWMPLPEPYKGGEDE